MEQGERGPAWRMISYYKSILSKITFWLLRSALKIFKKNMCGILFVAQKDIYIEENKKEKTNTFSC